MKPTDILLHVLPFFTLHIASCFSRKWPLHETTYTSKTRLMFKTSYFPKRTIELCRKMEEAYLKKAQLYCLQKPASGDRAACNTRPKHACQLLDRCIFPGYALPPEQGTDSVLQTQQLKMKVWGSFIVLNMSSTLKNAISLLLKLPGHLFKSKSYLQTPWGISSYQAKQRNRRSQSSWNKKHARPHAWKTYGLLLMV